MVVTLIRRFERVAQAVTAAVLVVNATLLVAGVISPRQAVLLFVAVEVPLACVVIIAFLLSIVVQCRNGAGLRDAALTALGHSPFWPFVRAEIRAYRALWLWIRGRHSGVEPGAIILGAHKGTLVMPVAFAVATVVEIVVLHLLLPWMWLRVSLAVASVWSLVALFGYLAIHRTNPHYLTDRSLVLRQSGAVVAVIARTDIESIAFGPRFTETTPAIKDDRLYLPNADGTNVDLALARPVLARLPALMPSRRITEEVSRISVYVDEPPRMRAMLTRRDGGPTTTLDTSNHRSPSLDRSSADVGGVAGPVAGTGLLPVDRNVDVDAEGAGEDRGEIGRAHV